MRKIYLILIVILFVFVAKGQSLVDTNKVWSEIHEYYDYATLVQETKYLKFAEDTTIGAYQYKKVMRSDDEFMSTWYHYNDYFIREDSSKKVFLHTNGQDKLIYDFSVDIGDSILLDYYEPPIKVYIDTIYNENVLGVDRKKIVFSDSLGCQGFWYEGIGYTGELFPFHFCMTGPYYSILCVKENGNLIYQNPNYSECFYLTDIKENTLNSISNIYPNPANDLLNIELENNLKSDIKLYNSTGELIYNSNFINKITINTSSFYRGVYVLEIINTQNVITEKIIIQ